MSPRTRLLGAGEAQVTSEADPARLTLRILTALPVPPPSLLQSPLLYTHPPDLPSSRQYSPSPSLPARLFLAPPPAWPNHYAKNNIVGRVLA